MSDCCSVPNDGADQSAQPEMTFTVVASAGSAATDDCCSTNGDEMSGIGDATQPMAVVQHCPVCGKRGKKVDTQTVKSMLAISLEEVRPLAYRFCRTTDCSVVYFSEDGSQVFGEAAMRELVHQKHPDTDDVFACYCFRHTPATIREEIMTTGESTAVARINAGIKAGQCACEIRNPQGSCCLGNVAATVKRVQAALEPMAAD